MSTKNSKKFKWLIYLIYIFSVVYFLFKGDNTKAVISFISLVIAYIISKLYFKNVFWV